MFLSLIKSILGINYFRIFRHKDSFGKLDNSRSVLHYIFERQSRLALNRNEISGKQCDSNGGECKINNIWLGFSIEITIPQSRFLPSYIRQCYLNVFRAIFAGERTRFYLAKKFCPKRYSFVPFGK